MLLVSYLGAYNDSSVTMVSPVVTGHENSYGGWETTPVGSQAPEGGAGTWILPSVLPGIAVKYLYEGKGMEGGNLFFFFLRVGILYHFTDQQGTWGSDH